MHINWQKTLLITLDVALATYLGFALPSLTNLMKRECYAPR